MLVFLFEAPFDPLEGSVCFSTWPSFLHLEEAQLKNVRPLLSRQREKNNGVEMAKQTAATTAMTIHTFGPTRWRIIYTHTQVLFLYEKSEKFRQIFKRV